MNPTIAFLLGGLLLLVWAALLLAFKQLCLDKIKRSFWRKQIEYWCSESYAIVVRFYAHFLVLRCSFRCIM